MNRSPSDAALDAQFDASVKAIGDGIDRLMSANVKAIEALEACRDYFDDRADAELDSSGYTGNDEMRLLVEVDEALAKLRRAA